MITDPVNVMELSAIVVLHPSQLNNDIYNNLKDNRAMNFRCIGLNSVTMFSLEVLIY